jgi:hypothetical protein
MMKLCEGFDCVQWAQWRATLPDKSHKLFCQPHKDKIEKLSKDVKFIFVGAIPDGISDTQLRQN